MEIKTKIIVVGGGISGCTVLHYLQKRWASADNIDIKLIEKSSYLGGTVSSVKRRSCILEAGPNGFIDYNEQTFQLIQDLDLKNNLISANKDTMYRYIAIGDQLCQIPRGVLDFIACRFLKWNDKVNIVLGLLSQEVVSDDSSIENFAKSRFGETIVKSMVDPMIAGIYGGDIEQLNFKVCFPKIYTMLRDHGSFMKAFRKKDRRRTGTLKTLQGGMGEIISRIEYRYPSLIKVDQELKGIRYVDGVYHLTTDKETLEANHVIFSIPSYAMSTVVEILDKDLSQMLNDIDYTPIVVIGLIFNKEEIAQQKDPVAHNMKGFGFLVPSSERLPILGVLFEDKIYEDQQDPNSIVLRVMLGGSHNRDIVKMNHDELLKIALKGIYKYLCIREKPVESYVKVLEKGIPQYTLAYCRLIQKIEKKMAMYQGLHICANYYKGVSFNDCVSNAHSLVKDFNPLVEQLS